MTFAKRLDLRSVGFCFPSFHHHFMVISCFFQMLQPFCQAGWTVLETFEVPRWPMMEDTAGHFSNRESSTAYMLVNTSTAVLAIPAKTFGLSSQTGFNNVLKFQKWNEVPIFPTQPPCYMPNLFLLQDHSIPVAGVMVPDLSFLFPCCKQAS